MKYEMKECLSAIDVLLSLALEQKKEYLGEESSKYCCEYNEKLKNSVHKFVKNFIDNKIRRGVVPVKVSLIDMYPIINSCSDFDDIFDGYWKKMNSYIKKTFKVYDTSHGAFSIDISDNKSDKKTSEVEKSSSVLDSSSYVSCESKTSSDKNSNLIVSSYGLYIYDATELFKSLDACFSRIVYDKNYYLYSEYGLVNHNYCTSYDESLKSGVHDVIKKKIESMIESSNDHVTIDIMDAYEVVRNSSKFDRIFEGCRFWVENELENKFDNVKRKHGDFIININKNLSENNNDVVIDTNDSNFTSDSIDTSKLEDIIDVSISRIMYDKNHILFSQYGVRDKRHCTEYDDGLKEAVHGVIRKLINRKLSSSSIIITTMEVYNEICKHPKFDKIFEGCKLEVDSYLKDRFSSYDEKNGPFVFDTNTVGNKSFRR